MPPSSRVLSPCTAPDGSYCKAAAVPGNRDPFGAAFQRLARGESNSQRLKRVGRGGAVRGVAAADGVDEIGAFSRVGIDLGRTQSQRFALIRVERQFVDSSAHLDAAAAGAEGVLDGTPFTQHFES